MTSSSPQGASVDRGPRRARTLPLVILFTLAITGFVMLAAVAGRGFTALDRGPVYAMSETAELSSACLGDRVAALSSPGVEVPSAPEFAIEEDPPSFYNCTFVWAATSEVLPNVLTVQVVVWDETVPEYAEATAPEDGDVETASTAVPGFANSACVQSGAADEPDATYICRLSDANMEVLLYHSVNAGDVTVFGPESVDMIALAADVGEAAKAAFRA